MVISVTTTRVRTKKKLNIGEINLIKELESRILIISGAKNYRFNFECPDLFKECQELTNQQMNSDKKELIEDIKKELANAKLLLHEKYKYKKYWLIFKSCIRYPLTSLLMFLKIKRQNKNGINF